jgi:hypothetical protein
MRGFVKVLMLSTAVAVVCAPKDARADAYVSPNNNTVQFGSFHFWRASAGVVLR